MSVKHTSRLASFKGKVKDYKAIVKIEKDVVQETQCIHIDSPDHLYIVDDWIVTHNTSSLAYSLFYIINYLSGYKDKEGKLPLIAVSATTLTFLKKTLVGSITSLLDSSKSPYKYDKANNILTINGVQVILLATEDESAIYGYSIYCSICDELDELPTDNAMAVVKALNDRTRQIIPDRRPPFLMFGTTSQGLKGTYLTVDEFKKKGISHLVIRGATKDNIYLPKEFVEAMYKIYDDKETACLLEGKFIAIDTGRVFPQFDMAKHYLPYDMWDSLPAGSTVYLAQDFNQGSGFNKAIAVYVQDGVAYVIKEYDFPDWVTAPKVFRSDFRTQKLFWIPDMTYKDNFTMVSRSLQAHNIRPVYKKSNPLVSDRNFAINACFHSERLFVCHFCKDAAEAFMHWQNDKRTGQPSKGKTASAPDHYGDCLGYAMYHIICNERSFKDIFDTTLNRLNKKRSEQGFITTNGLLLREVSPANKD